MPVYTMAKQSDLDRLDEVAPTLCYELVHYLATPDRLAERDEWSVNASKVYAYVRKSMELAVSGMMLKVCVKDLVGELQIDDAEASRAATLLGDNYSGASWHPNDPVDGAHWVRDPDQWGHAGHWVSTDW